MKIIVDGFGGDNAPLSVLQGCELAVKEYADVDIIVTGDENSFGKLHRSTRFPWSGSKSQMRTA